MFFITEYLFNFYSDLKKIKNKNCLNILKQYENCKDSSKHIKDIKKCHKIFVDYEKCVLYKIN